MFRTANKVTRPEKALILGFMAGSRDNPCPHLGMKSKKYINSENTMVKLLKNLIRHLQYTELSGHF